MKPECCQRALKDEAFDKDKKETVAVDQLKESELDAIYLAGGHGVCWDFVGSEGKALVTLVEQMYTSGKVVVSGCISSQQTISFSHLFSRYFFFIRPPPSFIGSSLSRCCRSLRC